MKKRSRKKSGPKEDLSGLRFGKLTVICFAGEKVYPSGGTKYLWKCQCDCGEISEPTGNALKTGNTTSCRKCIYNDLSGQVFGKLTVTKRAPERNSHGKLISKWECQCECGNSHVVSGGNLIKGNVKSCGCLFDDVQAEDLYRRKIAFVDKARIIHNQKYNYNLDNFVNTSSPIKIICPVHGEFIQKARDHIAGSGCKECFLESVRVGNDEFIRRSIEVHGDKYDYSQVEYKNNSEKVVIVCPEHGVFEQMPSSHMNGSECPSCGSEKRRWNYKAFCLANPGIGNEIGTLYLLKLSNSVESFLKIGVSRYFNNRIANYKKYGFDVEVVENLEMKTIDTAYKEYEILKYVRDNGMRYTPITKFAGWTECADLEFQEQILKYFEEIHGSEC